MSFFHSAYAKLTGTDGPPLDDDMSSGNSESVNDGGSGEIGTAEAPKAKNPALVLVSKNDDSNFESKENTGEDSNGNNTSDDDLSLAKKLAVALHPKKGRLLANKNGNDDSSVEEVVEKYVVHHAPLKENNPRSHEKRRTSLKHLPTKINKKLLTKKRENPKVGMPKQKANKRKKKATPAAAVAPFAQAPSPQEQDTTSPQTQHDDRTTEATITPATRSRSVATINDTSDQPPAFITPAAPVMAAPLLVATNSTVDDEDLLDLLPAATNNTLSPLRKGRSPVALAEAAKKVKKRQPPVRKGCRIKARRSQIYHLLPPELQQYLSNEHPNYYNYYGTVVKKTNGRLASYDIAFDDFRGNEVAHGLRRTVFTTVPKNSEEVQYDAKYVKNQEEEDAVLEEEVKDTVEVLTEKKFAKQSKEELLAATSFTHSFANKKRTPIKWTIRETNNDIDNDEQFARLRERLEDGPTLNPDTKADMENLSNGEFFIKHIFPDMTGFAKRMDEYYSSNKAEYYVTVKDRKFRFHDEDHEDPDWKLKQVVLLIIHGVNVNGTGVDQYWRSGKLEGNIDAADFGKYFDVNEFRCIAAALPFMWADKNHWYRDHRDVPWDVFMPFIQEWNQRQQDLFDKYGLIIIDETIVAWVPKTSRLGGLPNYSFEPRKPKGLGTMLRDGAIPAIGIVVNTDPQMSPSIQDRKLFADKPSQSPEFVGTTTPHSPHVAETLRQAYYAGLSEGDWVGGDAWFGSVASCLALKLQEVTHQDADGNEYRHKLNVDSTFVVKNNTSLFPRKPLFAILQARYGKKMAGKWVVFETVIQDVKMLAIAYAWSNRNVTYLVSTIGNTNDAKDPYVSFDPHTGFDGGDTKMHPRPDIANFLMTHLPTIDTSNKMRQGTLKVEDQWPTKSCWRKLLHGYMGISVVNQQKLFSYFYPGVPGKDMSTRDMAASISASLTLRNRAILPQGAREVATAAAANSPLKRIATAGNVTKRVTEKQLTKRSTGSSKQRTCFMCKKYSKKYRWAVGACPRCDTCLCIDGSSKKDDGRRLLSCHQEHLTSEDPRIRCNGIKKVVFPPECRHESWS